MQQKIFKIWMLIVHFIFWSAHWAVAFFGFNNLSWNGFSTENNLLYIAFGYGILSNMLLFYWQYFITVPYFFIKHKYFKFIIITILFFLVITIIEGYLNYYYSEVNNILGEFNFLEFTIIWLFPDFVFNLFYAFLGFVFRFPIEYFNTEKIKQELLRETHQSELKYLKAQLNPHFLFNGINSIYHLIDKNSSLAKNTLLQFSDLLRYQLYESSTQKIIVQKELDYVLKYIEIEKIRKGDDIVLEYDITNQNKELFIAPLLLIPFIENTFKHISNNDDSSRNIIKINIEEKNSILTCEIENTYDTEDMNKKTGGIGLQNVQRRLALLYHNQYELKISKEKSIYKVFFKLNL